MTPKPNELKGMTATSSSRRVYLLRRLGGGMILLGIILLFFKDTTLWFDLGLVALGVLVFMIAGRMEARRRCRNTVECDENGNAVKNVL